jgi:hypothetical protein
VCVKGDDGGATFCLTTGRCRHHRSHANVPPPSHRSRASGLWWRTCVCLLRHAPPPIVANQLRPVPRGAPSLTVTPLRAQPAPPNLSLNLNKVRAPALFRRKKAWSRPSSPNFTRLPRANLALTSNLEYQSSNYNKSALRMILWSQNQGGRRGK